LARPAIQAGLLLNGVAAITLLMFMAIFISSPDRVSSIDLWLLKRALLVFGVGVFLAGATFVNAQDALASGKNHGHRHPDAPLGTWPDCRIAPFVPRRSHHYRERHLNTATAYAPFNSLSLMPARIIRIARACAAMRVTFRSIAASPEGSAEVMRLINEGCWKVALKMSALGQ
jgi:hypothetical protein